MSDDERKPRLHIHTGGLIILVIILIILFRVDLKSKINSPQFQKNISYIETQAISLWENLILNPIKTKIGDTFINVTNKELEKIQDNFTKNVIKVPTDEDIEDAAN